MEAHQGSFDEILKKRNTYSDTQERGWFGEDVKGYGYKLLLWGKNIQEKIEGLERVILGAFIIEETFCQLCEVIPPSLETYRLHYITANLNNGSLQRNQDDGDYIINHLAEKYGTIDKKKLRIKENYRSWNQKEL